MFFNWIKHYLSDDHFIDWCIENKTPFLKIPHIKHQIEQHIKHNNKKVSYLTFWKILTSDISTAFHSSPNRDFEIFNSKDYQDPVSKFNLLSYLEPIVVFKEGYKTDGCPPFNADIDISISYSAYEHLKNQRDYPQFLSNSLIHITNILTMVMDIFNILKKDYDPSLFWLRSISPDEQNKNYQPWTILIEMLRDIWEWTYNTNPKLAGTVIDLWKNSQHSTFKRLVIHSYMKSNPFNGLDYLLEQNGKLLWDRNVKREKYRLLNSIVSGNLPQEHANQLVTQILERPILPRESKINRDSDIYIMLTRLQQFGMKLPQNAQDYIVKIKNEHPDLPNEDEIDDRFEFSFWSSSDNYDAFPTDLDETSMFLLTIDEIIEKLREKESNFLEGRLYTFRMGCAKEDNYEKCFEIIKFLEPQDIKIWENAITGISRSPKFKWENIEVTLNSLDDNMFLGLGDSIKECLYKLRIVSDNTSSQISIELFEKLISQWGKLNIQGDGNIWDQAINHPFGELTEVVLRLFEKTKDTDQSTSEKYLDLLTLITKSSNITGKVILAFYLSYLLQEATSWTRENLIQYFQQKDHSYIWHGLLNNPKQSLDALDEIKEHLKNILIKNWTLSEEDSTVELISSLATYLCINFPNIYEAKDKQIIIRNQGIKGLKVCAKFIYGSIKNIELAEQKDTYWKNKIEPFFREIWPKDKEFKNATISFDLVRACLQTTQQFSQAFSKISPLLNKLEKTMIKYIIPDINHYEYICCERNESLLMLLEQIIPDNCDKSDLKQLSEILSIIKNNNPSIEVPKRLENLLQ